MNLRKVGLLACGAAAALWAVGGFISQRSEHQQQNALAAQEVEADPDDAAANREYEKIVLATIDILTEQVEKHPENASLLRRRAYQEYCIGLYKEAIYDLDQSVKLDSFNRFAFALKGDCLFELGDHDKAIGAYSRAITLSPQDDHSYFWRGQCHLEKQNIDLAKRDLVLACELNPENCPENQVDDDDDEGENK